MELLLSIQQRFILDTLRKLDCVRRDQLLVLTRKKFRQSGLVISEARMETMLRQLRNGMGDFRSEGGLVKLSAAPPNALRLEAIDVMLELTQGAPLEFSAQVKAPLLLQFTWGQDEGHGLHLRQHPVHMGQPPPSGWTTSLFSERRNSLIPLLYVVRALLTVGWKRYSIFTALEMLSHSTTALNWIIWGSSILLTS